MEKVQIQRKDGNGPWMTVVDAAAQFNPEKLSISKKASWKTEKTWKSNIGNTTFTGGNPMMLSIDLFFDTTRFDGDVRIYTDALMGLTMGNPAQQKSLASEADIKAQLASWKTYKETLEEAGTSTTGADAQISALETSSKGLGAGSKGAPPKCKFVWGSFSFVCIVESVNVTYNMFRPDGVPVRARAKVKMKQIVEQGVYGPQNPTSRSASRKIWIVNEGQTLDWIAFQEYGKSSMWRYLAEKNNIDNPMDIKPGQILDV